MARFSLNCQRIGFSHLLNGAEREAKKEVEEEEVQLASSDQGTEVHLTPTVRTKIGDGQKLQEINSHSRMAAMITAISIELFMIFSVGKILRDPLKIFHTVGLIAHPSPIFLGWKAAQNEMFIFPIINILSVNIIQRSFVLCSPNGVEQSFYRLLETTVLCFIETSCPFSPSMLHMSHC